jgi:methyl-accepting chemotaxis protein
MTLLSRFRLRTKIAAMVLIAVATTCAVLAVSASLTKSRMLEDRVNQLRGSVDMAIGLAETLQEDVAAGKLTQEAAILQMRALARRMMFDNGNGYIVAYTPEGMVAINAALPKLEGKITGVKDSNGVLISAAVFAAGSASPAGGTASYLYPRPGGTEPAPKLVYARKFAPWNVVFSVGLYVDDLDADVRSYLLRIGGIGAALLAVLALASWLIARDVLNALRALQGRMARIADGALDEEIAETARGDEIGRMAETLESLRRTALTARELEQQQAALKQRGEQEKREALIALADRFDASVGQLVGQMASGSQVLERTARSMTGTAERTNSKAGLVSAAAAEASSRVQTVASAAEELSSSIGEISRQVVQSATVADEAVASARRTDSIVRALSDGAKQIEDVAELISGIAAQTNLLALNATIEAARAGEAGRGFAVVATEVKSLAGQTAEATKEIGTRITQIQGATREAVEAIQGITATIEEVSRIASTIASAVEEQRAATAEIARSVTQTAEATRDVTSNIGGVSAAATETGGAAGEVLGAASGLSRQAEQLSGEVATFLQGVRAA